MQTHNQHHQLPRHAPLRSGHRGAGRRATTGLHDGDIAPGLDDLFDDLSARREDEPEHVAGVSRARAWTTRFAICCTRIRSRYRAFSKPRGYAGDAVMMDYIYGLGRGGPGGARTPRRSAARSFSYMDTRPSARAVRYRRRLIADLIDRVAARGGGPCARARRRSSPRGRRLSARRADRTRCRSSWRSTRTTASLAVVARDYARLGVRHDDRLGPADSVRAR